MWLVIARFSMDDVPVFCGTHAECIVWLENTGQWGTADWESLRRQARISIHADITTSCACLWLWELSGNYPVPQGVFDAEDG